MIYSYTNSGDIVLSVSIQIQKSKKQMMLCPQIFKLQKINRYYGKRVKIYANEIPEKVFISNLKNGLSKRKNSFFKGK